MVLVHSIHESGKGAVEVLAEESSGASQAAEAFSAGAFAISRVYHTAVGCNSGAGEGYGGGHGFATSGVGHHGGSAENGYPVDAESGGSYGYAGRGAVGGGGGGGYGWGYGGAGQGWGDSSWVGGEDKGDGYGCSRGGRAEVGVDGRSRYCGHGAGSGGEDWHDAWACSIDGDEGNAVPPEDTQAGAADWHGSLPRDACAALGHEREVAVGSRQNVINHEAFGLRCTLDVQDYDEEDPSKDAAVQATLARLCVDTPGFYNGMVERTEEEELSDDADSLMSSDDEQGGVGSLSGFSLRSIAGNPLPTRTSRAMTALAIMQEDRQSRRGGSNPSTSTGSSRTNSSADGNSGDDLDVAGVGAGAAPSAGKASTAGRVDEAVSRAFTGEAWRTQLEGAKPAAQSPTVQPEFEQAPYLSLDGIEEPRKEQTPFDSAFDFPFLYGSKAGGNNGNGNGNGHGDGSQGELPEVSAAAGAKDTTGLSFWKDPDPLDFSRGGGDGVTESHGSRDRAPSYDAAVPCAAYGCYGCDDNNSNNNNDGDGEEGEEVDEAALALAADSLLGYAAPTVDRNPSRDGEGGDDGDKDEEIDEAALTLAAAGLLGYDATASGGKTSSDALVDGVAYGSYGCDYSGDVEEEEEADEEALAMAADGLLGYDVPTSGAQVPTATSTREVADDRPSFNPATVTSGAATGNLDNLLPGGSARDELSANRHDGDAAAADGVSSALLDRRFRRLSSSPRVFSNPGQQQESGGHEDGLSTSDESTDGNGGGVGGDAAVVATPPALRVVENCLVDEGPAEGPASSGGGGAIWVAVGANDGDGGHKAGDDDGVDGETAGGGQKVSGVCGGSTLEQLADGQRTEECFAKTTPATEEATSRERGLMIRRPVKGAEHERALTESDLSANGGGIRGGGEIINGFVSSSGTSDEPGRLEALSQRLVGCSSGIDRSNSHAVDNEAAVAAAADSDDGEGAHRVEAAAPAVADEFARREEESISVGPAASAESATARQPRDDVDEGDVGPRPQFAAVRVAGTAGAAAATARETVGNVSGWTSVADSPEPPVHGSGSHSAGGREGDEEGAGTNEEAFVQDAGTAMEGRGEGAEAAGDNTESVYFEGVHPSAPVISAVVGGPEVGGDVDGTDGGERDASNAVSTPSPPGTSWFDRVAATPAVGLLRRWLQCSDATVGNPASSGPRVPICNDAEGQELASVATSKRGRRLDAGCNNTLPTVAPIKGAFNERVEDWRVRDGHRRSRCVYGTAL